MSGVSIHTDISADFTNPLAKQVARIWQVPFAIEILLPLETSDLNPGGICAPDCRLILVSLSLSLSLSLSYSPFSHFLLPRPPFSPLVHFGLVISLLVPSRRRRRPVTRQCRISRGPFLAANVTLLRSTKQTPGRR